MDWSLVAIHPFQQQKKNKKMGHDHTTTAEGILAQTKIQN